jgi:hypothetical protein
MSELPPDSADVPEDIRAVIERARQMAAQLEVVEPTNLGRPMARPRRINWQRLAHDAGIVSYRYPGGGFSTPYGSGYAERALEILLGPDSIREAVALAIRWPPGRQPAAAIAQSVLRYIRSLQATELAYQSYKGSQGDDAGLAVGLIADIAHPRALDWVEEFLGDPNVAPAGIGVLDQLLDQLLFRRQVEPDDERVQSALRLALSHRSVHVRRQARQIRADIRRRTGRARRPASAQQG